MYHTKIIISRIYKILVSVSFPCFGLQIPLRPSHIPLLYPVDALPDESLPPCTYRVGAAALLDADGQVPVLEEQRRGAEAGLLVKVHLWLLPRALGLEPVVRTLKVGRVRYQQVGGLVQVLRRPLEALEQARVLGPRLQITSIAIVHPIINK